MTTLATAAPPSRIRRNRSLVVVLLAVLGVALLLAWAGGGTTRGYLDPDAAEPQGSRAVASILRDLGVDVVPVRTAAEAADRAGPGTTLLVTGTELLGPRLLERIAAADPDVLLLVQPDDTALPDLAPGVRVDGSGPVEVRQPRCDDPTADRAGAALTGGTSYADAQGSAVGCYPGDGSPSLLRVPARDGRPETVVLGTGEPLTNDRLADEGDAALALGLLGSRPTLVWYRPSLTDPLLADEGPVRAGDLVPGWVPMALAQLVVAALLAAAWRARRLGPVVTEPLPVVVRAAEATEGRARLYRRNHDRAHAADALRRRAMTEIAVACGLPAHADRAAIVAAAQGRTGRTDTAALLAGRPPNDDADLVRLADQLDALVTEVRRT